MKTSEIKKTWNFDTHHKNNKIIWTAYYNGHCYTSDWSGFKTEFEAYKDFEDFVSKFDVNYQQHNLLL